MHFRHCRLFRRKASLFQAGTVGLIGESLIISSACIPYCKSSALVFLKDFKGGVKEKLIQITHAGSTAACSGSRGMLDRSPRQRQRSGCRWVSAFAKNFSAPTRMNSLSGGTPKEIRVS